MSTTIDVPGGLHSNGARRGPLVDGGSPSDGVRTPPLVLVEWHDAWFDFDLAAAEERRPDYVVRTVGFLVAEDPRFLSLAQEVLPEGEGFRAVTHIPVAIVERVRRLSTPP